MIISCRNSGHVAAFMEMCGIGSRHTSHLGSNMHLLITKFPTFCQCILSGIPQGSILGPMLFSMFVNDLVTANRPSILSFPDDTKYFVSIKTPADSRDLQLDLDSLAMRSKNWSLGFNEAKCAH